MAKKSNFIDPTLPDPEYVKNGEDISPNYMGEIMDIIRKNEWRLKNYFIQVICHKAFYKGKKVEDLRFILRETMPAAEPDTDCWHVDNKLGELRLIWTLPPYVAFGKILANPENYDPFLVESVQTYRKAEKEAKASKIVQLNAS